MSKYSAELRFICESLCPDNGSGLTINKIIETAAPQIFDFDFPLDSSRNRKDLTEKIIRHFYTREIGEETYGLWQLKLQAKMNEIMPYYNQLYNSETLKFDPFNEIDYTETNTGENESNSTGSGSHKNEYSRKDSNLNKFLDTPQGELEGIETNKYLTSATIDDGSGSGNNSGDYNNKHGTTSNGTSTMTAKGKRSWISYSKRLQEYRKTMLNIDMQIIEELQDLFMLVY